MSAANPSKIVAAAQIVAATRIVTAARSWLATPYHHQASVKGVGVDCLGLARGIWRDCVGPEPWTYQPYSPDWGETGPREVLAEGMGAWLEAIPTAAAQAGALVLFRMERGAIAKHAGILSDAGQFIHAHHRVGVIEEPLTLAWQRRIVFAFTFPQSGTEGGATWPH